MNFQLAPLLRRFGAAVMLTVAAACASPTPTGPYSPSDPAQRDATRAEQLTREAVNCADDDPAHAESLLREALTADLYHGPAHNNLGVLYFREGKLYEAANEFEWARKLLPGHPDPRLSLALVLERAGHTAEAFAAYDGALEVAPEYVPALQAYARLAVREGRHDGRAAEALRTVALRGEDAAWRAWAQAQAARLER
jgi:tetratricopeptide (TPR) repeat protein